MTREEFYKLIDILNSDVLGSFMHGGEADELIAMFEEVVEHSNILKQEEPVSEDLEIAANEWDAKASFTPFYMALDDKGNPDGVRQDYTTHAESFKAGAKWQKAKDESTTEDLSEYINELSKQFPEVSFAKLSRIAVRVAKWQKEHIKKAMDLGEPPYLISIEQAYYRTLKLLEE